MATRTAPSEEPVSRPPMARPNVGLVGWATFGLVVLGLLAYGFLASRGPSIRVSAPPLVLPGTPGGVRTYGSVAELWEGDVGGKVSLSVVPSGPGVVGLGSLSELRGEIAIVRGRRWFSYPESNLRVRVAEVASTDESAAFLAIADVPRWQTQRFEQAVPFDRLATELEQRAARAGLDTTRTFPLLIEGKLGKVEVSVVNGPALGSERPTRERVRDTAVRASTASAQGSVVGFFAGEGGERLVHLGERLHLHVVLPAEKLAGHLESARIEAGSSLRLPVAE